VIETKKTILMIKLTKPAVILLLCSLTAARIYGQVQPAQLDNITGKFIKYTQSVPWEDVFVHTDREEYIAGEELWFNVYLIDRQRNKPSSLSRIVYFEVLNPDNHPVVQKRIEIEKGFGPGQVILPDTLSTGNYTLRAYTNWMKNFLPSDCFMKNINIYNTLNSRSYRMKPDNGKSPTLKAARIGSQELAGKDFTFTVNKPDPDNLVLSIVADDNFIYRNGNVCYLLINTHGVINYSRSVRISGKNTSVFVPVQSLIPGINQITFFNSESQPIIDKFIYTPEIDPNNLTISISENLKTRDHISLEIDLKDEKILSSDTGNISISVAPCNDINYGSDIADYMIFGSEFGVLPDEIRNRKIEEIPQEELNDFLQTINSRWIDWNIILSNNLPVFKYKFENESHFIYGTLFNRSSNLPDGEKYIFLSTPAKTASFQYAKTDKDGRFSFAIPIVEALHEIIIQPEETDRNNTIKIESAFSEEFLPVENHQSYLIKEIPKYISNRSINYQVRKIYGSTSLGNTLKPVRSLPAIKRFYGKPDLELIMDDYIKLPVMQEVFFELMPGVILKSKKSQYEFSILDPVENRIYNKPPVLLIDGVVINDASVIANLDPEIVEKIDAVKEPYLIGDYLFYGLVNVVTRRGDFSCVTLPDYAVRLQYRVVDPANSFSSPDYSTQEKKESSLPDLRNTLYWNPSVQPDNNGKISVEFWASDYASDYMINIQGLTGEGRAISYTKVLKIK
jgi:hypothetical protein